ncbi:MAG: undecaprenyl/decaprenyl-phosphate alpha-N-acetylglucosaminyl 1-phosphate transferase [Eggerthellaceae bacterium]|nr:undecaprenyl/decaprenyl-phosphate alpha-N-acetylglucosaminyl 1-phosphate transferase [Eggerthellaceae bacterium]
MAFFEVAIVFGVAFAVTFACVPLAKRIARLVGAIDYPGNRRVNTKPIPRCGGIAMYLGFCAAAFTVFVGVRFFDWELQNLYVLADVNYYMLFAGVTLMFLVGLIDDITQLNPAMKFGGQIIASLIVVIAGISVGSARIPITGDYVTFGIWDYPISVLYLLVFVNITNLIDGLDGLASGVVAIVSCALLYLVMMRGFMTMAFVCVGLIAICLAFLCYNFFPASIFMGDSGSMLLGLLVGIVSVAGVARTQSFVIMVVPLAIAGVPVLDTISAIIRRLRGHQSIGQADQEHIHHKLLRSGLSQKRSVALLWICTAALSVVGCVGSSFSGPVRWTIFLVLLVVVFFVIWRFGLFRPVLKHHYDNLGGRGPRLPRDSRYKAQLNAQREARQSGQSDAQGGEPDA